MKIIITEQQIKHLLYEKLEYAAGVLPIARSTGRILIHKRGYDIPHGGTWATFGGKPDPNETPKQTARREFREESGYEGPILKMKASHVYKRKNGFRFYNNLILVANEFKVTMIGKETVDGEVEVIDAKWVTLDELKKMKDLHFGLEDLIKNSEEQIRNYIKIYTNKK